MGICQHFVTIADVWILDIVVERRYLGLSRSLELLVALH